MVGGFLDGLLTENYGKTIILADYTPKRSGYDFAGWYKDEKLTEKIGIRRIGLRCDRLRQVAEDLNSKRS